MNTPSHVLTLVAADGATLDDRTVGTIAGCLPDGKSVEWLAPGIACDLAFDMHSSASEITHAARSALNDRRIDFAIQPGHGRRKKLLIADMDSTIVVGETLDELAAYAGLKDKVAAITAQAMRGELDFKQALRARVAMLTGLAEAALAQTYTQLQPMPGAAALVATMKAHGAYAALVSGGFDYFTSRIKDRLGFDVDSANSLQIHDGHLTGAVNEPIRDRDAKRDMLIALCTQLDIAPDAALAVGDGANDLKMIGIAGMGVAYHAKPAVREAARFRVDHGDLTTLLYYQGYRHNEIVA